MTFYARATRGRGLPSPGLMARFGVPVGGWVRKLRAVDDQSAPIPEEITNELGRSIYIVRRAQSRIDQATLENQMGKWEDTRSGRPHRPREWQCFLVGGY